MPGLQAHPRVGGENEPGTPISGSDRGSSPRGRGKPCDEMSSQDPSRLIPAWAGKTDRDRAMLLLGAAHPRVGGENTVEMPCQMVSQGSSPRGRGKLFGEKPARTANGLIPAWAGKTI